MRPYTLPVAEQERQRLQCRWLGSKSWPDRRQKADHKMTEATCQSSFNRMLPPAAVQNAYLVTANGRLTASPHGPFPKCARTSKL